MDIEIGRIIEIGGVGHTIQFGPKVNAHLAARSSLGEYEKAASTIKVRSDMSPDQTMASIVHEAFHGVSVAYCAASLTEEEVSGMAQGATQILRQLGIRLILPKVQEET